MSDHRLIFLTGSTSQHECWIAAVLKQNVHARDARIMFGALQKKVAANMAIIDEALTKRDVVVIGPAVHAISSINDKYRDVAEWHCLWRDPVKQLKRISANRRFRWFADAMISTLNVWCGREHLLRMARRLDIPMNHLHMDDMETVEGMKRLITALGLPVQEEKDFDLCPVHYASPQTLDPNAPERCFIMLDDLPKDPEAEIMARFNELEYSSAAYAEALEWLSAKE